MQRHTTANATNPAAADGNVKVEAVVDRLAHAITRTGVSRGDQGSRYIQSINLEMAAAALQGLTPQETGQVEVRWRQREKTDLRQVIWGKVPNHLQYNNLLTEGKAASAVPARRHRRRHRPVGTGPDPVHPQQTDKNALDADLMQLHDALLDTLTVTLHSA